jgi:Icc-related predicted phosphoesterase
MAVLRLLAGGDPHQDLRKLEKFYADCAAAGPDAVLLQGDYLAQHEKERERAAGKIAELFRPAEKLGPRFFALSGNYEPPGSTFVAFGGAPANVFPLGSSNELGSRGNVAELNGFTLVGVEGSNPINGTHPGERSEEELRSVLRATIPAGLDPYRLILVTHVPPFQSGKRDELGMFGLPQTYWGKHVGSTAVREALAEYRPLLHVCGHVHEGAGVTVFDWRSNRILYDLPTTAYERFLFRIERSREVTICLNHGTLEHWVYFAISIGEGEGYVELDIEKRRLGGKDPISRLIDPLLKRGRQYDKVIELRA